MAAETDWQAALQCGRAHFANQPRNWVGLLVAGMLLPGLAAAADASQLAGMSLAELGDIEVTSVSKSPELLREAPAAIFVITQDDIQRSGATSLVEALRLAPNIHITQQGSNSYTAAARGLGGNPDAQNFPNKLLLLIDGRSVYSPLYSGIFLDSHDVLLSDVSRIEVISGPGATLWGANAMHGVINVITMPAYLTEGTAIAASGGNLERGANFRFGARAGEGLAYRVYGKAFEREAMRLEDGSSAGDTWDRAQAGFRIDSPHALGTATLQGDVYGGENDSIDAASESISGANMLARWQNDAGRSAWHVQSYFDHVQRGSTSDGARLQQNTFDIEAQQDWTPGARHRLIWGAGARFHRYRITNTESLLFDPSQNGLQLWNVFAQDTVSLSPSLKLTVGIKFEHNSYSGWEPQPDARLAWQVNGTTSVWASASRAIRAPTPFDVDVIERIGGADFLVGNPDFRSEEVVAYETGFRSNVTPLFSLSMSAFYNRYNDLRTVEFGSPPTFLPLRWDNLMKGNSYGMTAWATLQLRDWWRLAPGFTLLDKRLKFKPGASELVGVAQAGNDPTSHALLTSSMDIGSQQTLHVAVRHVAKLPEPALPAYTELSARYAWRVSPSLELSVRGTNLLNSRHREYPAPAGVVIRRGLMAEARWRR